MNMTRAALKLLAPVFLLVLVLSALPLAAQTTIVATPDYQPLRIDRGAAALQQSLRKLRTRASVMMIVAHP